jgi:hypothetical protein
MFYPARRHVSPANLAVNLPPVPLEESPTSHKELPLALDVVSSEAGTKEPTPKTGVAFMARLIWKKIVATYDGRVVTAQYARDGAYVRVSLPGKAEERMKHRKQRAKPLALGLLIQMAAESKK